VGAANEAAAFQLGQVAADAGRRGAGYGENLFDGGGSGAEKEFDDEFTAAIEGFGHTGPILTCRSGKMEGLSEDFLSEL
jgi:hypothetical protein